jgi:hypothetical protein
MATSPIYSWPEPDNTDLVKNGALAIRTLGNAIDTTMGTMVAKTVVDAKGDLIAGTAADTVNRLAVGNNGETLVADSSTSTGLRYTAGNPIPNPVLNSSFQVAQRGTSFTTASAYTLDRWYYFSANTGRTISQQATSDTTNLPNIQYCLRLQRDSGNTATGAISISQSMESINSIPYAGKTVTLSFYARVGANYSGGSSFISQVRSGTGTDQNLQSGYTGSSSFISNSQALTTTWTRYTYTGTMPTTGTEMGIYCEYTPTGTAGANDYVEVTGFQIDISSVALPFRTNGATLQGELAACQRYAWTLRDNFDCYYGLDFGGGAGRIGFVHPVSMRTSASYTLLSGTPQVRLAALTVVNATPSLQNGSTNTTALQFAYTGGLVGTPIGYVGNGSVILFSAEL